MTAPIAEDTVSLRAEIDALRSELDLLHDALERMPHGMCAFDNADHLVLANAHYRKIGRLPEEVTRRGGEHPNKVAVVADDSSTVAEMRTKGVYVVLTPEEMVERGRTGDLPLVSTHPACGGLPAEPSWHSLRLMAETVLPALRT